MARASAERFYVYALLEAALPDSDIGPRMEIVPVDELFAAIQRRSAAPRVSEAALRQQHRIVMQLAKRAGAILPARFGTLVDRLELERVVRMRRVTLKDALRQVRGKQQMTIRVFGAAPAKRPSRVPASGTEYLRDRAASRRPVLSDAATAIRRSVRSVVSAERVDPARPGLQATMHHLVRADAIPRYLALLDLAVERLEPPPRVSVSGPFPPFAFAPDLWSDAV